MRCIYQANFVYNFVGKDLVAWGTELLPAALIYTSTLTVLGSWTAQRSKLRLSNDANKVSDPQYEIGYVAQKDIVLFPCSIHSDEASTWGLRRRRSSAPEQTRERSREAASCSQPTNYYFDASIIAEYSCRVGDLSCIPKLCGCG